MARTGDKPARLRGEGVRLLLRERSQGRFSGVNTVAIGIELGAGTGVLQIIDAVVLGHKDTLYVRLADGAKHGRQSLGVDARRLRHLGRQVQLAGCFIVERLQ